jgi:anaerobic selenocysteine-containing dehydrogenase
VSLFGSKVAQLAFEGMRGLLGKDPGNGDKSALPEEHVLSLLLKLTKQDSFKQLTEHPHGVLREDHQETAFLGKRVLTDDGKVNLSPDILVKRAQGCLPDDFEREKRNRKRLKLITKRAITTHNSWTHNYGPFVEGDHSTNYLYMHPADAKERGIEDGAVADVTTDTGAVRVPVRYLKDLMPGTVALPHGWGHQHAKGLSVASRTSGVNVNILAADGPTRIEPVSGMAHLTGFVVDVEPARGPRDAGDWSGMG